MLGKCQYGPWTTSCTGCDNLALVEDILEELFIDFDYKEVGVTAKKRKSTNGLFE
jgi:hypothetical protein